MKHINHSIGAFLVLFPRKKIFFLIMVILTGLMILGITRPIQAAFPIVEHSLGPEEEVEDDLLLQGNEVNVAGKVHGMLLAIGEKIIIQRTAQIDNNIFILGKSVSIEEGAVIKGDLFIMGQNVAIDTLVQHNAFVSSATLHMGDASAIVQNLYFGGFHFQQSSGSVIQGNFYAGCYQLSLHGTVNRNLRTGAVSVDLNGEVNGNAEITIDSSGDDEGMRIWLPYMQQLQIPDLLPTGLKIGDRALIKGKLIYTSAKSLEENLTNLPLGGVVENKLDTHQANTGKNKDISLYHPFLSRLFRFIRQLVGFIFFALISWKLSKKYISEAASYAISKPIKALGVGLISTMVFYLGSLVFVIILIFITILLGVFTLNQLSRTVLLLGIGLIMLTLVLFSIIVIYISKFSFSYWVGSIFFRKIKFSRANKEFWSLMIGIVIYLLLYSIPVFGWIFGIFITLIGLGAIWYTLQNHDKAGLLPDFE